MRKIVFLCLVVMLFITGCGEVQEKEQKLVCTTVENEDGMDIEQVISMTYKNDKLKFMKMEVNTTVTDPTVRLAWEEYKKYMAENNEEFSKDGISLKVEIDDQNYKYNTILDIDVDKASEEDLKEQGFEDLKEDQSTIEDSKKLAEEDGATCEIK